jgi:hypothetical protein
VWQRQYQHWLEVKAPSSWMRRFLEVLTQDSRDFCRYSFLLIFYKGVIAAKAGTLTFMVGGPEKEFASTKSVLSNMGKNIVYCGTVGSGQAAKICNNMLLAISMVGTAEAMNLGVRFENHYQFIKMLLK